MCLVRLVLLGICAIGLTHSSQLIESSDGLMRFQGENGVYSLEVRLSANESLWYAYCLYTSLPTADNFIYTSWICKDQMGLNILWAESYLIPYYDFYYPYNDNFVQLECKDNTSNNCSFTPKDMCFNNGRTAIYCPSTGSKELSVRLTGGEDNRRGRLEMLIGGRWSTVCKNGFELNEAEVVCRQLGFSGLTPRKPHFFTSTDAYKIFLSGVKCMGNETRLIDCRHTFGTPGFCEESIGVECPLPTDYNVRLTGGHSANVTSGRLEIQIAGKWWGISGYMNTAAIRVACRQMGQPVTYARVQPNMFPFPANESLRGMSISCNGSETDLSYCTVTLHRNVFTAAGMICSSVPDFQVRLVGGTPRVGRLEVKVGEIWGTECDDHFGQKAAGVVCRQLGFDSEKALVVTKRYGSTNYSQTIWLDDISCGGHESSLLYCAHDPVGITDCSYLEEVSIMCLQYDENYVSVRLVGGEDGNSGRLEVNVNDEWGTVCDDSFDEAAAEVVCRQLGLPYQYAQAVTTGHNYRSGSGHIWLDDVTCTGSETNIALCSHSTIGKTNCDHSEDVAVKCGSTPPLDEYNLPVRLVGGEDGNSGRLEVNVNDEWGTVCDDSFDEAAAEVVCRQLGLPYQYAQAVTTGHNYRSGSGHIWLDDVTCTGSETNIALCSHRTIWESNCDHSEDVAVECRSTPPPDISDYSVRLRDGNDGRSGRVEVFINGEWGTVCDDYFSTNAAKVVCNQLGFTDALPEVDRTSHFHSTSNSILLDNVDCLGWESTLGDCDHRPVGVNNCGHSEDVYIKCEKQVNSGAIVAGIFGALAFIFVAVITYCCKKKGNGSTAPRSRRTQNPAPRLYTVNLPYTSGSLRTGTLGSGTVVVGSAAGPPSYEQLFPNRENTQPLRPPSYSMSEMTSQQNRQDSAHDNLGFQMSTSGGSLASPVSPGSPGSPDSTQVGTSS